MDGTFDDGDLHRGRGTDTAPRDFTKLDPNYRNKAVKLDGLCWHDAFKAPFELEGAPFRDQQDVPTRFPMELTEKMTHPGAYRAMGRQGAGMSLRFRTNANRIAFRATYGEFYVNQKMPMAGCGFDFYRSGRWAGNSQPPLESKDGLEWSMSFGGTGRRDGETFQLYFPLQCGIEKLQIGLPETAEVFAPEPRRYGERPIAFYGSSITHCGCVSRPGLEHGARVGRFLDAAVHNFGYCGNCFGELAAADAIASVKPLALVMEYDDNAWNAEHLEKTHEPFFRRFRELCPKTPVLMMTSPVPLFGERSRQCVVRTWLAARDRGDRLVDFIDSTAWFDSVADRGDCFMDGGHQNDIGAEIMAKSIAPCGGGRNFAIISTSMPKNGMDTAENRDRNKPNKEKYHGYS